jgi:four helix bundle protein
MATIKTFEEIESWKEARILCKEIYRATESEAFKRDYSLKDQIRRSASSILLNIAEGFERDGNKEFINFLSIAKGSAGELRATLYIALDLGYIDQARFEELQIKAVTVSKLISSFINYLKKSDYSGTKYQVGEPEINIINQ